ncbi:MAG: amidohydrolase, partial [Actinomycetes bacterium]
MLASLAPLVKTYADELVALRRDIHAHPELSWQETRTTALVAAR